MPIIDLMRRIKERDYPPRPIVKTRPKGEPLPVPRDDRDEAIGWYLHLRVNQELERGHSQTDLEKRTKVSQPIISNIKGGDYKPGMAVVFLFADYFRQAEWELVRDALEWWVQRGGREYAFDQLNKKHQARMAASGGKKRP